MVEAKEPHIKRLTQRQLEQAGEEAVAKLNREVERGDAYTFRNTSPKKLLKNIEERALEAHVIPVLTYRNHKRRAYKGKYESHVLRCYNLIKKEMNERYDPRMVAWWKRAKGLGYELKNCRLLRNPELYKIPYVVEDAMRYRAAMLTLLVVDTRYLEIIREEGWMGCIIAHSRSAHCSPIMRRILMNLPGMSPMAFGYVLQTPYDHTITDRLVLLTNAAYWANVGNGGNAQLAHLLMHATREELIRAREYIDEHDRQIANFDFRSFRGLMAFVSYLNDGVDRLEELPHGATIMTIARQSVARHAELYAGRLRPIPPNASGHARVKEAFPLPRIPAPEMEEIEWIATYTRLRQEGATMQHCVATYGHEAAEGRSYFFHIKYKGETATAQVKAHSGDVVQCYGPCNRVNKASVWGQRVLNKWGKDLVGNGAGSRRYEVSDVEEETVQEAFLPPDPQHYNPFPHNELYVPGHLRGIQRERVIPVDDEFQVVPADTNDWEAADYDPFADD
jgi:hypothetical protein